jgi:hypothetical protein
MKTTYYEEHFKMKEDSGIPKLVNPGVPVAVVYYSHVGTPHRLEFNADPRAITQANQHYEPDNVGTCAGDGVVPVFSSLIAPLKWAAEYDAGKEHAKPVKIIEMCSTLNQKPFWSGNITSNEYIGVSCECMPWRGDLILPDHCDHATIIHDEEFINYLGTIITTSEINTANLTKQQSNALQQNCPHLL